MKKYLHILVNLLCCNTQFLQQKTHSCIFQSSHSLIVNDIKIKHFQKLNINSTKSFYLCKRIIYCIYAKTDYY
jgi:hypothetical protein